nr:hypothetical protein [Kibdelosporangium sp. MJ126-NF4]
MKFDVHVMTSTVKSAIKHARTLMAVGNVMGIDTMLLLPAESSDQARLDAYKSRVVVGTIDTFLADLRHGLRPDGEIAAVVEGNHQSDALHLVDVAEKYATILLL